MNRARDLAAAVADLITAGEYSQDVTAQRVPLVDEKLTATGDLQVFVAPAARSRDLDTRGEDLHRVSLDVAVLQKLSALTTTVIDPLDDLLEDIEDDLFRALVTTDTGAAWRCTAAKTLEGAEAGYAWSLIRQPRVYLGVVRLTFRKVG